MVGPEQSDPVCRRTEPLRLTRRDLLVAAAVAALALALYIRTLAPGLLQADAGELQTLAATLGYAHPTGYPVFILLAKLATLIPVGDVAYRVNLLSAAMGALAVALLYLLGRLLTERRWASAVGALALAVSPTFWSQAIIAEVYTAGVVCMVSVLLGLELWQRTGRVGWLSAAGCVGGVSLGVHSTVALMAPAALLLIALTPQRRKANWAAAVAGGAAGVAITLAAFAVVDRADSPTSYFRVVIEPSRCLWDLQPEDLDGTLDRVRLSMSPPQFRGLLFSQPFAVTRLKAIQYGVNLTREFPPLWLAAAVAGLFWLGRRNRRMAQVLVLTYFLHLAYDLQFDGVVYVMYVATYVPVVLLAVAGLAQVSDLAARLGRHVRLSVTRNDLAVSLVGLGVVLWPMLWADAWNSDGRRAAWLPPEERDTFPVARSAEFHQQVRELIADLEPNAVVLTGWCVLYPYYYVAYVEQGRTDLTFIQHDPQPRQEELADSLFDWITRTAPRRPIYLNSRVPRVAAAFELKPVQRGAETLFRLGRPKQQETDL